MKADSVSRLFSYILLSLIDGKYLFHMGQETGEVSQFSYVAKLSGLFVVRIPLRLLDKMPTKHILGHLLHIGTCIKLQPFLRDDLSGFFNWTFG